MGSGLSSKYSNTYGSKRYSDSDSNNGALDVREETVEYKSGSDILRKSNGKSSINENAADMPDGFKPNEYGNFGRPGKNCRVIECADPVSESAQFYKLIGKGGEIRSMPGKKGSITRLDDGTRITYRVITKTKDSPAVEINIKGVKTRINGQKIHFIGKEDD